MSTVKLIYCQISNSQVMSVQLKNSPITFFYIQIVGESVLLTVLDFYCFSVVKVRRFVPSRLASYFANGLSTFQNFLSHQSLIQS